MRKTSYKFILCSLLFFPLGVLAQITLKGRVSDTDNKPIAGVNVFIKGTTEGTSTDEHGLFTLKTHLKGDTVLVFRFIAMNTLFLPLQIKPEMPALLVKLTRKTTDIEAITITAGNFGVGDRKKSTVMTTMDVETTAGSDGDITGALRTLPGTQQVGESGQLFVRGGSGDETKIMIDGLSIPNPFFATVPDVAQRNRFSPHLFKGIVFNTGGYSAQYGGALSSVLTLETKDHPSKPSAVVALIPYGAQVGRDFINKKETMSGGIDVGYFNFSPYYKLVSQNIEWIKAPESGTITANFRKNTAGNGLIKWYGYGNIGRQSINYPDVNKAGSPFPFTVKNGNAISLLTYTRDISAAWKIYTGYGFNINKDQSKNQNNIIDETTIQQQLRLAFTGKLSSWAKLDVGIEGYNTRMSSLNQAFFNDSDVALWAESDVNFGPNFIIRPGIRGEYDEIIAKVLFLPRLAIAYRTTKNSQLNFSAGEYAQKPSLLYRAEHAGLDFTKATHYIANYQYAYQKRLLRAETYYKNYNKLITTIPTTENTGNGYAYGIDLFWRDSKTINGFDFWISYTWLQTQRKFMDYPARARPTFAAPHTAHLVLKYFIEPLGLFLGSTYSVASGRPYYNPQNQRFLADRTPIYQNLNLNIALLRKGRKTFNTFVFAINNLIGQEQIFNYRYANNGSYRLPITLPYKRSFMLGWFISIGQDRSAEILEQLP